MASYRDFLPPELQEEIFKMKARAEHRDKMKSLVEEIENLAICPRLSFAVHKTTNPRTRSQPGLFQCHHKIGNRRAYYFPDLRRCPGCGQFFCSCLSGAPCLKKSTLDRRLRSVKLQFSGNGQARDREANKAKILEKQRRYRVSHRKQVRECNRRYYACWVHVCSKAWRPMPVRGISLIRPVATGSYVSTGSDLLRLPT
ncbi:uncharacterized protein [Montipora capricornis]|uniref:uncharacterized protein n=1 Tax=Montipora capricornis TaxID=246305 RepID=UPI0035F1BE16